MVSINTLKIKYALLNHSQQLGRKLEIWLMLAIKNLINHF